MVNDRLVTAIPLIETFRLEDFPGEYCYVGSSTEPQQLGLLEMFH
jgi:hypothetical protein